ncbi:MAG: hypothetical protein KGR98_00300 [Verrucomicrobia bacterium]|nr:hypothetical protein [Verrucomicrobiota bacterium]MDE3100442.1 hypothetical protein [Verrucomicrobiota bacterium]
MAGSTNLNWFARSWQTAEGLPNNRVDSLAQTPDGFLWVATPRGLARFDGVTFDEISLTNYAGQGNRGVAALLPGREGGLWVEMDRGAVVDLNGNKTFAVRPANAHMDSAAQTMIEWGDGRLWISYLGGAICSLKGGKATVIGWQLGLPWAPVGSIAKDSKGRLWLARAGEVGIFHHGKVQLLAQPGNRSIRLARARAGGVWICAGGRLFHFDEGAPMELKGTLPAGDSHAEASAMLEDRRGNVWVGTAYNGLFRFDGSRFEKIPVSYPEISCLLEDNEGNIWVGTHGGGLDRLRPRAMSLENAQNGLPFEAVQSLCEDAGGDFWAVTDNGLLARRGLDGWQTIYAGWPGGRATCVASDKKGGIWIGTRNYHLIHFQGGRFDAWNRKDGLGVSPIAALMAASNDDLWIGGYGHELQFFRDGHFHTVPLRENTHTVRAIAQDAAGKIWIGTSRGLLLEIAGGKAIDRTEKISGAIRSIRSLRAAPDGSLWIGYAGFGLGRLKSGHFGHVTTARGLFDNYISEIVPDGRGWIWLGSDHGIFKARERELIAATENPNMRVRSIHYGRGEGLAGLEANFDFSPRAVLSRDGRVWMSTQSALVVIDPEKSDSNSHSRPPPVFLKRVIVDGKTVAAYGGPAPLGGVMDLRKPSPLRLPPNHRDIEFDFTALNFSAPENARLQYRLDGLDGNWIDANPERAANFSRLPPGQYRFRARAGNGEGAWNENGASFAFSVTPFLWQRWWFRSAALVAFAAIVIVAVRYISFRRLRWRLRALEQQAALDKERARIARDLHDDLGSHLTEIVLLSDLMLDDPDKSNHSARRVSETARQVIKTLDETVWAVNPRNDTLAHLIDYIGQFAVEFLRMAGISCQMDAPLRVPEKMVSTEVRHNLFLVVKEALNNIVTHANATEVSLKITINESDARIAIEDNGRGFALAPNNGSADGLRNMRRRIEEIGGEFDLQSRPATGTRITVTARLNQ